MSFNLPPSRAHAHVERDTDDTTPMFPEIPSTTIPDTMAVVAFLDPVVLRRIVTRGLEEFRRMSVDGMHILQPVPRISHHTSMGCKKPSPLELGRAKLNPKVMIMTRPERC